MRKKRVAESMNIRVNLGNYQHLQLTKYVDEVLEFETDEERVKLEKRLNDELVSSMVDELRNTPKHFKLGQDAEVIQKVETAISTSIPEWLENDPVPNIADNPNEALNEHTKVISEQQENKEKQEEKVSGNNPMIDLDEDTQKAPATSKEAPKKDEIEDPFDEDDNAELF